VSPVESRHVTREVVGLSKGARIAVLVALLLLVAALFFLFVPLEKGSSTGQPFRCGTAASPEHGDFPDAVCGGLSTRFRLGAGALGVAAVVVGAGGVWAFGTVRRVERRQPPDVEDD
jgi:hypothetical protein